MYSRAEVGVNRSLQRTLDGRRVARAYWARHDSKARKTTTTREASS
jgi:hypothetical protein